MLRKWMDESCGWLRVPSVIGTLSSFLKYFSKVLPSFQFSHYHTLFSQCQLDDTFIKTIMTLILMIIPEIDSFMALVKDGPLLIYIHWCSVKMEVCPIHWPQTIPGTQFSVLSNAITSQEAGPQIRFALYLTSFLHAYLSLSIISHLERSLK